MSPAGLVPGRRTSIEFGFIRNLRGLADGEITVESAEFPAADVFGHAMRSGALDFALRQPGCGPAESPREFVAALGRLKADGRHGHGHDAPGGCTSLRATPG